MSKLWPNMFQVGEAEARHLWFVLGLGGYGPVYLKWSRFWIYLSQADPDHGHPYQGPKNEPNANSTLVINEAQLWDI